MDRHGFIRRALVGLNPRTLGYSTIISLGTENDLKFCAVTDSKLLFIKWSLGATSARYHFLNLERVITVVEEPEYVCYF